MNEGKKFLHQPWQGSYREGLEAYRVKHAELKGTREVWSVSGPCKQGLSPLLKCFLQCWISRGEIQGVVGRGSRGPPLNPPWFWKAAPPAPYNSLGAAELEFKVRPQLGREGDVPQQKKEATFQVQNLHLNQFINPTVQIRREGRRERREQFTESRTKIALLNTSFLSLDIFPMTFKSP